MTELLTTRLFLRLFVASVLANAVLGIWALLTDEFGETQGKVLVTSFLLSAAMLSVLVNTPAIRRAALWPVPLVGAASGAAGFALFVVLIWAEVESETWFKLGGTLLVVAAAATLAASLALITPPPGLTWLQLLSDALIAALALTIVIAIWLDPSADWFPRLVGVEGVLVAAMTLLLPVLSQVLSFGPDAAAEQGPPTAVGAGVPTGSGRGSAVRFCPSCGQRLAERPVGSAEPLTCSHCGLVFDVVVTEMSA